jgi:hypothetical protein
MFQPRHPSTPKPRHPIMPQTRHPIMLLDGNHSSILTITTKLKNIAQTKRQAMGFSK